MANEKHLKILREGVKAWNNWRECHPDIKPDLSGVNFRHADFQNGIFSQTCLHRANLSQLTLIEINLTKANLIKAKFEKSDLREADFSNANLHKADFSNANLSDAGLTRTIEGGSRLFSLLLAKIDNIKASYRQIDFSFAQLSGVDFRNANLTDADFSSTKLTGVRFSGADFTEAIFNESILYGAIFEEANLSEASFNGADLSRSGFKGATLTSAVLRKINLRNAKLSRINLGKADLSEADLSLANFRGANLSQAILQGANLRRANLSPASLSERNPTDIEITENNFVFAFLKDSSIDRPVAYFRKTNLSGSNLSGANLEEANLNEANLCRADLSQADLSRISALSTNFSQAIFTGVCIEDWHINRFTKLDGVICDYVYLKRGQQERHPHSGNFLRGEFTKLFQEIENTIDLIFRNGINWQALAIAFNQVNTQILDSNEEGEIFLREYKVLGDGLIALKVTTPPGAAKANLRDELMIAYEKIASLEGELKTKNELLAPLYERLLLPDPKMSSNPQIRTILILSANPKGTSPLRLDEEVREIKEGLRRATGRDQFSIVSAEAVRYRDIHRAILDYNPQIIHFSGHGAGVDGLVFEDETGRAKLIDAKALADLFELFADHVECVVLNACYSQEQAKAIRQKIGYVVGMGKEIGDKAAIEFAVGFYDALGAGKPIDFAYKLGCKLIRIAGIPEHLTPKLLVNPKLKGTTVKRELTSTELQLDQEAANQLEAVSQELINLSLEAEKLKFNNIRSQAQYNLELDMKRAELEGFLTAMYGKPININKANSTKILKKFPGITQVEAKAIVNNRPDGGYRSFEELVKLNKGECPNASWDIIEYLVVIE